MDPVNITGEIVPQVVVGPAAGHAPGNGVTANANSAANAAGSSAASAAVAAVAAVGKAAGGVGGAGGRGDGGGGGENTFSASADSPWNDSRALSEQIWTYPATCFLAAAFVTVSK